MPRQARIDTPGVLHHVIIRGIERRNIFRRDEDRDDLIDRLSLLLPECRISCYAWAFMSNHAHFLFRTGDIPLSTLLRRLLTGYVVGFNRRHNRCGHLFQNRYKSFVCQEDIYLKELVRYIHLNPLRANVISSLSELNAYKYSGHSALAVGNKNNWQDARGLFCYWAVREMGYTATHLAEKLNRTVAGVVYAIRRGEKLAKQRSYKLLE